MTAVVVALVAMSLACLVIDRVAAWHIDRHIRQAIPEHRPLRDAGGHLRLIDGERGDT